MEKAYFPQTSLSYFQNNILVESNSGFKQWKRFMINLSIFRKMSLYLYLLKGKQPFYKIIESFWSLFSNMTGMKQTQAGETFVS